MGSEGRRMKSQVRRKLVHAAHTIAGFCLVTACATQDLPKISVTAANAEVSTEQAIASGDALRINVFDEPELTGEFAVDSAGRLAMPLIEPLSAAGQTPSALTANIKAHLVEGGYVLSPRVSVEQLNLRPVYILGEVAQPGEVPYTPELTYLQVVAKAGGFTPRADRRSVLLQRRGWNEARKVVLGDATLKMAPGDTILVEQSLF